MAYDLKLIELPTLSIGGVHQFETQAGLPGSFRYMLFNEWVCLGSFPRIVDFSNNVHFGGIAVTNTSVHVTLNSGLDTVMFDAFYDAPIGAYRSNVIVSVDSLAGIVKVVVNRQSLPITSGGWTGPFALFDNPNGDWLVQGSGSSSPGSNVGDLYLGSPSAFFDTDVPANLDKFITANLTPVDLGVDGSGPTGFPPGTFLTVRTADPNTFADNNGTGGPWVIGDPPLTFEVPGTCLILPSGFLFQAQVL